MLYCFFCASLTCLHSLLPSQSVSAVTSCFLTSIEKIKQQPSIQEIVLCYQIHDKEPSYTVKDYQQPSPSFLAKKLTPYKLERRCYTLNSAQQLTFVMPTSLGDFSSSFFLPCPGKARIPGFRRESRKPSFSPRKSWSCCLPDKVMCASAEVYFTSWRLFMEEQLLFLCL